MARYINTDNIPYSFYADINTSIEGVEYVTKGTIENRVPTEDVKPMVRGKWIKIQNYAKCSECMHEVNWGSKDFLSPYCPNCGAEMNNKKNRKIKKERL